jgi:uncharacterized membrane protein
MLQTNTNEVILDRIADRCIVAAKTNRAKQRLIRVAIDLAEKEQPTSPITVVLWLAFGFLFLWGVFELIMMSVWRA